MASSTTDGGAGAPPGPLPSFRVYSDAASVLDRLCEFRAAVRRLALEQDPERLRTELERLCDRYHTQDGMLIVLGPDDGPE